MQDVVTLVVAERLETTNMQRKKSKGFTAIELLIVIALVFLVVGAIKSWEHTINLAKQHPKYQQP